MKTQKDVVLNLNSIIDFTLLDPRASVGDIEKLCDIAYKKQYYSVCVNPCNVCYAKQYISQNFENSLKVVSVCGFPLGANTTDTKIFEAKSAILDGADEIDMVINIGKAKQHDYDYIKSEIKKVKKAIKKHTLKVILETCYLDENEIIKLCKVAEQAGADFVKTSTGFGTAGASVQVVSKMLSAVSLKCMVKASGGIKTREQALEFANLGVKRIGTSSIL